jgi:hypothetical protein
MCLCVELIVQSPFAPLPLQKPHRYYGLIRGSYSPVELRLFNLYQQPLLNRTFPTLILDLFWDALTLKPQEHLTTCPFNLVKYTSLP